MKAININPKILVKYFDDKVREQCKSCKRYNMKKTCPDNIESIDYYKELLPRYSKGTIYYNTFVSDNKNWSEMGKSSSLYIHRHLLVKRNELLSQGHYLAIAFTGGSCKLCSSCSSPCKHPDKALIPLEATGINVVELMSIFKIVIKFPITKNFYRVGLLLWD